MPISITIEDAHNAGRPFQRFKLELVRERLTVHELIRRRVLHEIDNATADTLPLIAVSDLEKLLNNHADTTEVQSERNVSRALKSFESGHFLMFVDDEQQEELEQDVVLTPNTVILFIRLTALQGG